MQGDEATCALVDVAIAGQPSQRGQGQACLIGPNVDTLHVPQQLELKRLKADPETKLVMDFEVDGDRLEERALKIYLRPGEQPDARPRWR